MAYKFQLGSAILSGSTKFEEGVELTSLKFSGSVEDSIDIAADSILFRDADGSVKSDTLTDYAALIAGDGLGASGGALSVGVDGSSIETSGDALRVKALGVTNAMLAGSITDAKLNQITTGDKVAGSAVQLAGTSALEDSTGLQLKSATAGDGLSMNSQVLSVNVDDSTIETDSDTLQLKDNGVTLAKLAGITRGSIIIGDSSGDPSLLAKGTAAQFLQSDGTDPSYVTISGDATVAAGGALTIAADAVESGMLNDNVISGQTELAHADIVDADELMISDGGVLKRVGVDSLRDHFFGVVSGDATIADGGALTIGANAVEDSMVNDNVATGLAGVGLGASGGVLAVQVSGAIVLDNDRLGLSGSLAGKGLMFEGGAESLSSLEVKLASNGGITKTAGSSQKSLALNIKGLTAADIDVAADFLAFMDESDGNDATKKESIADLMTAVAGNGLAASSGVLSVDASEVADAAVASGDKFVFHDATDDSTKKESIDDIASFMAGLGLGAASGVLSLDVSELGDASVASGDKFVFQDATDNTSKKESIDDIATFMAGNGLGAASGVLSLDVSELGDASVASGDKFVFQDATDNTSKKESIDDIATFMAGAGLTATSGVLSVTGNNVALKADGDTLAEGYNYFADASANATVSLPAAPEVGDVVVVKARDLTSGAKIIINRQGSHKIDGQNSVEIESPFGAVTCVYVVANDWRIV